jgi:nicotinate phosphoribosyltransferase
MAIFNKERLAAETFKIEADKIRRGWYSDKYFSNNVILLEALAKEGYCFAGNSDIKDIDCSVVQVGDVEVEMQFFTRRRPFSLVAGVDEALAIIKMCTGYYGEDGQFVNTYDQIEVDAVQDGTFVEYDGNPLGVQPVLRIRGRYRDFAKLETVILGVIAEPTRIATNVYNTLVASRSKDILFFPARFAHYKMQALHGYAYSIAIQAYNQKYSKKNCRFVSTDEQGTWWGGEGGGTIAHATICCFLGDTVETMMQYSRIFPKEVSRLVLIDFHNDCVGESRAVMAKMFATYLEYYKAGQMEEAEKYKLYGVRPDTSKNMRDKSIVPTGNKQQDMGVSPRLVWNLREAVDIAYLEWELSAEDIEIAKEWCEQIKICVTGGFNAKKIREFEEMDVPVDIYGVGSSLLENSDETNNDFTADIVRVKVGGEWCNLSKIGRSVCENHNLERI